MQTTNNNNSTAMETIKQLRELFNDKLHLYVIDWLEDRAEDYDNDLNAVLGDVISGGCASGIVSELIYYRDTNTFYDKFENEIWNLAGDFTSDVPTYFAELANTSEADTPEQYKNILAWWGFEVAAYNIQAQLEQLILE